jgi:3-oxoacyl-(acyl-carrier-protein) synthase
VVVTGWAWRTPLGDRVPAGFDRLCAGDRAFTPAARYPLDDYPVHWVAPLPGQPPPGRPGRFLRRMGLFALEVAAEALDQARPDAAGARLGLFFGYGGLRAHWQDMLPALAQQSPDGDGAWQRGFQLLHPFWMLQNLSNNAQALAAQALGARGDGLTLGGANAGAQAMAAAARALSAGAIDAAVVVGYDTLLEPESLIDLSGRGAYLGGGAAAPPAAYGEAAAGFVPGEAAAALVLERSAGPGRALARVAAVDAADGERGEPGPETIAAVLARAFRDAGGDPPQVVDGAARAGPALDQAERQALAAAGAAPALPICATLAGMGQLGAAASLVQTIALGSALGAGRLPPVAGLHAAAPGPLAPVTAAISSAGARSAIALSTGAPGLIGLVRVLLP